MAERGTDRRSPTGARAGRRAAARSSGASPLARVGALVTIVLLVLAFVGGALATRGDDGSVSSGRGSEIDAGGEELLDLLATGIRGAFHATYEIATVDAQQPAVLDLYRSRRRIREDLRYPPDLGGHRRVTVHAGDESATCTLPASGGSWTCSPPDPDRAGTDVVFGRLRPSDLRGRTVTVADDEHDGRAVRCFAFTMDEIGAEVCLTADGVPTVLDLGDGARFVLTALEVEVDDDVFVPPAPVTEPGVEPTGTTATTATTASS